MTTAKAISKIGGGGTAVGAPIAKLLNEKTSVDTFIGITDNEEWVRTMSGQGFLDTWRKYKRQVNRKAKAFLVTVMPYGHAVAPTTEPDVHFIYGWSNNVLPFISQTASGSKSQMDEVTAIEL